ALVDEHAPQPVASGSTLAVTLLDQIALALEDLDRQLTAVFPGHRAFQALEHVGLNAAVVLELLVAVVDCDASTLADELVVGAFVGIKKPSPAADVVDEDVFEGRLAVLHILYELLERLPAAKRQPALAAIFVTGHH